MNDEAQLPLFPDTLGAPLLDSFTVGAFRGLKNLTLENLGRINLLVGNNNCGKTSILEALAIYLRPLEVWNWVDTARSREVGASNLPTSAFLLPARQYIESILWMFPGDIATNSVDVNEHKDIILSASGHIRHRAVLAACSSLRGSPPEADERGRPLRRFSDDSGDDQGLLINISLKDHIEVITEFQELQLWSSVAYRRPRRKPDNLPYAELLAPYSHRSESQQLAQLSSFIKEEMKNDINELLHSLDENLSGVEITASPDGRRPVLMVRHRIIGFHPISVLGDGIRRALSIALAIPRVKNGLLLIDEIESALHVSVLDKLYPWLGRACEQYNVQVFATTHSLETIDAIAKIDYANNRGLAAYHLGMNGEETRRYTGGMLRRLVHERGLDIRRP